MHPRRWICRFIIVALTGFPCVLNGQGQAPKKSAVQAVCTRPDALFKVGETATFKVESEIDGEAVYRMTEDGFKTVKEGKLTLKKGTSLPSHRLTTTRPLTCPLRCKCISKTHLSVRTSFG